jgi:hypothetical protein
MNLNYLTPEIDNTINENENWLSDDNDTLVEDIDLDADVPKHLLDEIQNDETDQMNETITNVNGETGESVDENDVENFEDAGFDEPLTLQTATLSDVVKSFDKNGIEYELSKNDDDIVDSFCFGTGKGVWHWFNILMTGEIAFDCSYSSNTDVTKKGAKHGQTVSRSLERILNK